MQRKFEKWHGCLNDFILMEILETELSYHLSSLQRQAPQLCRKDGGGIGADGLLILVKSYQKSQNDQLIVINQDGSLAKNCGNGLRIAARFLLNQTKDKTYDEDSLAVNLILDGQSYLCQDSTLPGKDQKRGITVDIGYGVDLAISSEIDTLMHSFQSKIDILAWNAVELKNNHLIVWTNEDRMSVKKDIFERIQNDLPEGNWNVHFAKELEAQADQYINIESCIYLSTFENGVGFTRACGSGASAAASVLFKQGLLDQCAWVQVDMPGGRVYCQQKADDPIRLLGPTDFVFSGTLDY